MSTTRQRAISVALVTGILVSVVVLARSTATFHLPGNQQGYEPVQPIAYSHRLHAGELQIPCLYCHFGAERSRHAGIPASSICMNCHGFVTAPMGALREEEREAKAGNRPARLIVSAELRKLYDAMGLNAQLKPDPVRRVRPIEWTGVHRLPDFVYFDHRSHVNKGVSCQTCHGPVETMERVRQVTDLSMGWCVNCHREATRTGIAGRAVQATIDCAGCHY